MSNLFSERLKELRLQQNIKQKDLAAILSVGIRTIVNYENGSREPTISALILLADYFCVSMDYLIGRSNNPRYEDFVDGAEEDLLVQMANEPFARCILYSLPDLYITSELRKQTYSTEKRIKILFSLREQMKERYNDYKSHLEALKEFEPTFTNEIKKRIIYPLQKRGLMEPKIYAATSPEDREKSRKKYQEFHELLYGDLQEEESSDKSSLFKEKRHTNKTR